MATVIYTNGESEELNAGSLFYIGVGPSLEFKDSPWSVQALVGHHLDSVTATNGSMRFTLNTVDGQVFYRIGNHRLGAGLVTHFSPKYKISIDNGGSETGKFDTAQGASVEYNWLPVGKQFGLLDRKVRVSGALSCCRCRRSARLSGIKNPGIPGFFHSAMSSRRSIRSMRSASRSYRPCC